MICLVRSTIVSQALLQGYKYPMQLTPHPSSFQNPPELYLHRPFFHAIDCTPMADSSTNQALPSSPLCSMCSQSRTIICTVCNCSPYCSEDCRETDRPIHQRLCSSFRDFGVASAPLPGLRRAIVFPEDRTKPRFVWVGLAKSARPNAPDNMYDVLIFQPSDPPFGNGPSVRFPSLIRNEVLGRVHNPINLAGYRTPDATTELRIDEESGWSQWTLGPEMMAVYKGTLICFGLGYHLDMMSFRHIMHALGQ